MRSGRTEAPAPGPLPRELAWYELDRPDLLTLKDQVLTKAGAAARCARYPVGVDLVGEWAGPLTAAGFDPTRPAVWLVEGLIFYLEPATVHRLPDDITRLTARGSELLIDTVGQSLLDSPHTQAFRDRLASEGTPWQFGTDRPEDELLEPAAGGPRCGCTRKSAAGWDAGRTPSSRATPQACPRASSSTRPADHSR